MNDKAKEMLMGDGEASTPIDSVKTQEQSTAAPTVPGEGNGVEQPVAESVETNEVNAGTAPAKDDKAADDQKVSEGDGEPKNAKDDGDRDTKD